MALRIALAGISHETNTYCKGTTGMDEFEVHRGDEIISNARGYGYYVSGMIAAAEELGAELVPLLDAGASPSGTIAAGTYHTLLDELLERLRAAMPVDAIALALHGAGVVEGIDDLEGHLCHAIRDVVGPDVPIVCSLDLHGNITQDMADTADCLFGVHYYPHTDMFERGQEAIAIIPRLLSGEVKPVTHVETVPMLLPTSTTHLSPAKDMLAVAQSMEERPGMIDCTVFHGFPYTDIPQVGIHVVATSNHDRDLARACAHEVASWIWNHREEFRPETLTPQQAIERALSIEGGPVVINDTADNPGGGTPGDATHLLRAMIDADLQNAAFGFIYDPEVARIAHEAGVGATIEVDLGGRYDEFHGAPVHITAYVKCLTDGKIMSVTWKMPMDLGKMARLVVSGIDILVGSVRTQTLFPETFTLNGIDISTYKIVALKSSQHFRAAFQPIARAIVTADSPGLTTLNVAYFPRERSPRPIWPLDDDAAYTHRSAPAPARTQRVPS